jgi:hypothetical protein
MTKQDFKALTELEPPIGGETVGQYLDRMLRFQVVGLGDCIQLFEKLTASKKLAKAIVFAKECENES